MTTLPIKDLKRVKEMVEKEGIDPQTILTAAHYTLDAEARAWAEGHRPQIDDSDQYHDFYNYVSTIGRPGDTLCFVAIEHNLDGIRKDEVVVNEFVSFEEALTRASFEELTRANNTPSKNPRNTMSSIYLAMNTFPKELIGKRVGRTQENVVEVRALQADVDANGDATMEAIKSSASLPRPSIVVESSPGKFQGIWLVDGFQKEEAKPLMQAMAAQFNTDSAVADIARVMRVPGFVNRKYESAPVARTQSQSNARYTRADFHVKVPETPQFEQKPENWVNDVVIQHGNAYNDLLKLAGYYVRVKNINDPEMLYKLLAGHCENAVDRDGKTSWQPNLPQVRQYTDKWAKEFETGESIKARTELTLNIQPTPTQHPGSPAAQAMATPAEITPELLAKEFPAYDGTEPDGLPMLVEGFMPEGVGFFGSLAGTVKTWSGLSLAKALTTGRPLWGVFPVKEKVAVLYLIPEASDASFKRRMKKMGITQDKTLFRFRTVSQGRTRFLNDELVLAMVRELSNGKKVLIVVDTAIRFFRGGDENSSVENSLVQDSDVLRSMGVSVLFQHHSPKAMKDAAEMTLENVLRGSGDFGAMADFVYGFRRDENLYSYGEGPEEVEVVCVKPRDFDPPLPFRLQLRRTAKQGENGPTVSVIDEMGDLKYIGNTILKEGQVKVLEAAIAENSLISFNELSKKLKMKRDLIKDFAKAHGWKQVPHKMMNSKGVLVKKFRWTNQLLMGGQTDHIDVSVSLSPDEPEEAYQGAGVGAVSADAGQGF